jgi:flagellar biogenesis protein FliO
MWTTNDFIAVTVIMIIAIIAIVGIAGWIVARFFGWIGK